MILNNEFKLRVTAFIRTKDETLITPADPIQAIFEERENGPIINLFNNVKRLAKRQYQEQFLYIHCLRVSIVDNVGYKVKAFLNIDRAYITLLFKIPEGNQLYAFDKFFEHLIEVGETMYGEKFDGISYLKFFCLDAENIVVNFH